MGSGVGRVMAGQAGDYPLPPATMEQAQTIAPSGLMSVLPEFLWDYAKESFIYPLDFEPLTANGNLVKPLTIEADADFVLLFYDGTVTTTDNLTVIPFVPFLVNLKDTAAGRFLMQNPVHWENLMGDAKAEAFSPIPYYLRASSSLQVNLQNLDAANDYNVRLAFKGFRAEMKEGSKNRPQNGPIGSVRGMGAGRQSQWRR